MVFSKRSLKVLAFLGIVGGFLIASYASAFAEERVVGYVTRCLTVKEYYKDCPSNGEIPCKDVPPDDLLPNPQHKDHNLKLGGEGFPSEAEVFVVGCVTSNNNYVCTGKTGDNRINSAIRALGFDVVDEPRVNGESYVFEIKQNPIVAKGGKISVIARSYTPSVNYHQFFGVYKISGGEIPQRTTVKYGTPIFTQDPKQCFSVYWDPTGRVFDAKSLEPLPDAVVKILDENKRVLNKAPGFNPTQITGPDGVFSFMVKEGRYYLQVEKAGYSFPVDLNEIDPNFTKAYRCDPEVGAVLYNDQYAIDEKGKLIHCDVPLNPIDKPYFGEVVIYSFGHILLSTSPKVVKFIARFSHPYTRGILREEGTGRIVAETEADRDGRWEVLVPVEKVPQDRNVVLEGKKQSLGAVKKIISKVFAQEGVYYRKKVKFEPILPYVEGYVYDDRGNIVPHANVKIVSRSAGNTLLRVKADENGFIKILPGYLPIFSYYFQIEDPITKKTISYTTSQFVKLNKDYYAQEKLDLMKVEKKGSPIAFSKEERKEFETRYLVDKSIVPAEKQETPVAPPTDTSFEQKSVDQPTKRFIWAIIVLLAILMATTVGVIIFYIKSHKFR